MVNQPYSDEIGTQNIKFTPATFYLFVKNFALQKSLFDNLSIKGLSQQNLLLGYEKYSTNPSKPNYFRVKSELYLK